MRNKLTCLIFLSVFTLISPLKAIEVHSLKTPKGISVWFAPDKSVPIVSMSFTFKGAGSIQDPKGLEGLAGLAGSMRGEGAGDLDANAFRDVISKLGVRLSLGADEESFSGALSTTLETKVKAVSLLKDVLYRPRFDQGRIDLQKTQLKADMRESYKSPGYQLARMTLDRLYGDHSYGREATPESIDRITRDDLIAASKKGLSKSNLIVGVCGNLTSKEVMEMVDDIFGNLPDTVSLIEVPQVNVAYDDQKYVFKRDIPQTQASIYHPGLPVSHPDFMKLKLALSIFGQGFKARLLQEVREKAGLVYTIGSRPSFLDKVQYVETSFGTENAKVSDAFAIIQREFAKFARFGVTEQELKDAKKSAIGSYVLGLSSTGAVAANLAFLQKNNFPITYMNERSNLINAITLNDINDFIKGFFDPKKTISFMIGDPQIEANFQTDLLKDRAEK